MKRLKINISTTNEIVDSNTLNTIADAIDPKLEHHGYKYNGENFIGDIDVELHGNVQVNGIKPNTKKVIEDNTDLVIENTGEDYVEFDDAEVERVTKEKLSISTSGIPVSKASIVTDMINWWGNQSGVDGNTKIQYVDLSVFPNLLYLDGNNIYGGGATFAKCYSLKTLKTGNVIIFPYACCANTQVKDLYIPNISIFTNKAFDAWFFSGTTTTIERIFVSSIEQWINAKCVNSSNSEIPFEIGASVNYQNNSDLYLIDGEKLVTNVDVKDTTNKIRNYCFYKFTKIESITLNNILSIGISAFQGCTSLNTIGTPHPTTIGNFAFAQCINLQIDDVAPMLSNLTSIPNGLFASSPKINITKIPDNITSIGLAAFSENTKLTNIDLNNVTTLTNGTGTNYNTIGAFGNCTNLEYVKMDNVTYIGAYSFYGCSKMSQELDLSLLSQETLGKGTFCNCSKVTITKLSPTITKIDETALQSTTLLDIGNVNTIGIRGLYNAKVPHDMDFYNLRNIYYMSLQLDSIVDEIYAPRLMCNYGGNTSCFRNIRKLLAFKSPTFINGYGLSCDNLSLIVIDFNIESMGGNAFNAAWATLRTIILKSTNVPVFVTLMHADCNTYVLPSMLDSFLSSAWNARNIFAIGGSEWTEQFGSSHELAYLLDTIAEKGGHLNITTTQNGSTTVYLGDNVVKHDDGTYTGLVPKEDYQYVTDIYEKYLDEE